MAMTAREAAWTALQRWRKNGAWSDAALNIVLQNAQLAPRDAALAARICYGTLQNLTLLDHYLAAYCTTPLQKLEPKVLDLLRLSAYQIVLLDKVPPRAAVNEAVALCRKGGCARAAGLVNAVLRRVAEHRDALPEIPGAGTASYLSVRTSHPQWLAQMLIDAHGYDFAERALLANNADAPACLQVNTLKTTPDALAASLRADGIETQPHPWLPDALLCRGGNLAAARAFADGWFYVQDAAAHCAALAAGVRPGMRVLDACAAPGGKSFAAAVQMRDQGCMISCDIHENKWKRIRAGADRLGLSCISTRTMDARRPDADLVGTMDVVLADVPCSGLGVIRKKPEIRFKDPAALSQLPAIQRDILEGLAPCVRPGGVLVYSTCTVLARENEDVVRDFLRTHPEFAPEAFSLPLPAADTAGGMFTFWPQEHETDGFFVCKLRRHE